MSKEKPKRINVHGCYSVSNIDLGIKDKKGNLMKGEHDVFVMTKPDINGYVVVYTITSLENVKKDGSREFHNTALLDVKNGIIIPIPDKEIGSKKLSGINKRPIIVHISKLFKPNNKFVFPIKYASLL